MSYFVAELFNKLVVPRNDSSLTLHTPAYNQTTLNPVFLLNKQAFASVIQTRLVLKEKTYDAREHKGEVDWKLIADDPMISGGHQLLILTVVDNFFGNNHPIFPTIDVPLFFWNNYSTFPTVIVQNTVRNNSERYKLTKDQ